MAGANPPPGSADPEKLRQVLDYLPCDVCLSIESPEDQDTLCSICSRLNRTIVERVVVHGEPSPAEEREALAAAQEEDLLDAEGSSSSDSSSESSSDLEDEHRGPEIVLAERGDEEDDRVPVEVVLAEDSESSESSESTLVEEEDEVYAPHAQPLTAEEDTEVDEEGEGPSLGTTPWPRPGGLLTADDDGDVLHAGLSPFTVIAPVRGSVEGTWIVPGEEQLSSGEIGTLSSELSDELETAPAVAWPGDEDDADALDLDDLDVEAEPEQAAEAGAASELDEPDDSFWADLLEGDEEAAPFDADEDDVPAFESAEAWAEEPAEAEEAAAPAPSLEEDLFDDVWGDEPLDDEPGGSTELGEDEGFAFQLDDPDEEPAAVAEAEPEEDLLDFEEVEFAVADDDEDEEPVAAAAEAEPDTFDAWEADADEPDEVQVEDVELEDVEPATIEDDDADVEAEALGEAEWPDEGYRAAPEEPVEAEELEPDAFEDDSAPEGAAYTHGPYTLYHKVVETGDGETRDLYFFARQPPEDASPADLPDGYEVGVNERTGVPFVRRERS